MQAELLHLEQELKTIIQIDFESPEKSNFGTYWKALNDEPCEGGKNPRKEKIVELKEKIKEYCKPITPKQEGDQLLTDPDRCSIAPNRRDQSTCQAP